MIRRPLDLKAYKTTEELLRYSVELKALEDADLKEYLKQIDSKIELRCNFLKENPEKCTANALRLIVNTINEGDCQFIAVVENGIPRVKCYEDGYLIGKEIADSNNLIFWTLTTLTAIEQREQEAAAIAQFEQEIESKVYEQEQLAQYDTDNGKKIGRDPFRWLMMELRQNGDIIKTGSSDKFVGFGMDCEY